MLNPDRIQPVALHSVLLYPPTVRLDRGKLTTFYSTVCAYKPYSQFTLLPDGASMVNGDGSQLRLGPDRIAYKERIPENQSTFATVSTTSARCNPRLTMATTAHRKSSECGASGRLDRKAQPSCKLRYGGVIVRLSHRTAVP